MAHLKLTTCLAWRLDAPLVTTSCSQPSYPNQIFGKVLVLIRVGSPIYIGCMYVSVENVQETSVPYVTIHSIVWRKHDMKLLMIIQIRQRIRKTVKHNIRQQFYCILQRFVFMYLLFYRQIRCWSGKIPMKISKIVQFWSPFYVLACLDKVSTRNSYLVLRPCGESETYNGPYPYAPTQEVMEMTYKISDVLK